MQVDDENIEFALISYSKSFSSKKVSITVFCYCSTLEIKTELGFYGKSHVRRPHKARFSYALGTSKLVLSASSFGDLLLQTFVFKSRCPVDSMLDQRRGYTRVLCFLQFVWVLMKFIDKQL